MVDSDEDLLEDQLSSKDVFSGNLLAVTLDKVSLPSEGTARREVVHHPGGVVMIPILEDDGTNYVVMVKQFRHPIRKPIWELPAGTLEPGELPRDCAERELIEEIGYRPARLEKKVDLFTTPGYSDEVLSLYLATGLSQIDEEDINSPDEENIISRAFSVPELIRKARNGEIQDGKTLAGLFFLMDNLGS